MLYQFAFDDDTCYFLAQYNYRNYDYHILDRSIHSVICVNNDIKEREINEIDSVRCVALANITSWNSFMQTI